MQITFELEELTEKDIRGIQHMLQLRSQALASVATAGQQARAPAVWQARPAALAERRSVR